MGKKKNAPDAAMQGEIIAKARGHDGAEDPQEHMVEDDSPLGWARQMAEEEAAGLD